MVDYYTDAYGVALPSSHLLLHYGFTSLCSSNWESWSVAVSKRMIGSLTSERDSFAPSPSDCTAFTIFLTALGNQMGSFSQRDGAKLSSRAPSSLERTLRYILAFLFNKNEDDMILELRELSFLGEDREDGLSECGQTVEVKSGEQGKVGSEKELLVRSLAESTELGKGLFESASRGMKSTWISSPLSLVHLSRLLAMFDRSIHQREKRRTHGDEMREEERTARFFVEAEEKAPGKQWFGKWVSEELTLFFLSHGEQEDNVLFEHCDGKTLNYEDDQHERVALLTQVIALEHEAVRKCIRLLDLLNDSFTSSLAEDCKELALYIDPEEVVCLPDWCPSETVRTSDSVNNGNRFSRDEIVRDVLFREEVGHMGLVDVGNSEENMRAQTAAKTEDQSIWIRNGLTLQIAGIYYGKRDTHL